MMPSFSDITFAFPKTEKSRQNTSDEMYNNVLKANSFYKCK